MTDFLWHSLKSVCHPSTLGLGLKMWKLADDDVHHYRAYFATLFSQEMANKLPRLHIMKQSREKRTVAIPIHHPYRQDK